MSRILRKLYHEVSSSWDFRHISKIIDDTLINYRVVRDHESNYLFTFCLKSSNAINTVINFSYDINTDKIISHDADLTNDTFRGYYYKYIDYAYNNISRKKLLELETTIYSKKVCRLNEYIQTQYQKITFQIEGLFSVNSEILKIYIKHLKHDSFSRLVNYLSTVSEKLSLGIILQNIRTIDEIFGFFTIDELLLIKTLYSERRSTGAKNLYFSINKEAFVRLIPYIKNIQSKFSILETGNKLEFSENVLSLNFYVSSVDDKNYKLALSETHKIHQYFIYMGSYVLIESTIYKVNLPFDDSIVKKIFEHKFFLKQAELIYFKTVVGKQLSLFNNYLDFNETIKFPEIMEDTPNVFFLISDLEKMKLLNKKNTPISTSEPLDCNDEAPEYDLNIYAYIEYSDGNKIPISVTLLEENLFKLNFINEAKWYYLPDDIIYNIKDFIQKHLYFRSNSSIEYEWRITEPNEVLYVQTNLYEKAHPTFSIILTEKLKKIIVKTIELVPEIEINSEIGIDWFAYKVMYKNQNYSFSQEELRNYFASGAKYFTTADGSNIKISNPNIFNEIENLINMSKKDASYFHKMAIYRLPWIYELQKLNPAIIIHGDNYLDEMYSALQKRGLPDKKIPHYSLKPIMRSYQKAGYEWLKMLEKYRLNGILADEMGLGKTLQAISVLTDLPEDSKSLIVCPKTLLFNWVAEIEKFNPRLKYIIYEGNKEYRTNLLNTVPVQIVICSYTLIQNDMEEFDKIYFDYLILDEAQHIKNHVTLRAKAIKKIKARYKLAMTGTPLENSIVELWSMFDFLMPGYLPSLKKVREYVAESKNDDVLEEDINSQYNKIRRYIAPFILRRKKKDVLIELPDKQEQAIYCAMTEKQENHYVQVLNTVKNEVFGNADSLQKSNISNNNYFNILAALTRLRQICDHPGLINDEWLEQGDMSGKLNTLSDLVADSIENGRKVLIFSQYIKMLKLIENMIRKLKIPYEYMDGSTKDRKSVINHFNTNENVRIFLISLKTGGFGINLTAADTVILVDPWWNPMLEAQAIDRVHRIGQTKKVLVYKMITKGTVEEKIMILQKQKRDLFANVIDQGDSVLKNLGNDDLKLLFEYKESPDYK